MELQSNNVGSFLQCYALSAKGKRFSLIFLEEWGVLGGLGSKLRSISIVPVSRSMMIAIVGKDFFKRMGDVCGGFMVVGMDTMERRHLQWPRILINSNGILGLLHVVIGSSDYAAQLWWGTPLWLSLVF